jgi:hypothetical protein
MKKLLLPVILLMGLALNAQQKEKVPAAKGVVYGQVSTEESSAIAPDDIKKKDGTAMMVRAKDHAFLMPEDIVGKTVLIDGAATVKEVSEEMRRHYAEDAGKSKKEIASIKGGEKDVQFAARGVKVLD